MKQKLIENTLSFVKISDKKEAMEEEQLEMEGEVQFQDSDEDEDEEDDMLVESEDVETESEGVTAMDVEALPSIVENAIEYDIPPANQQDASTTEPVTPSGMYHRLHGI